MSVSRRIFWTTFGTACIAVLTFSVLLVWIARKVDAYAASETQIRVAGILSHALDHNALSVQDYGYWTAAFDWVQSREADLIYENLGAGAADSDTFDFLYIMSPQGTPQYAYQSDIYHSDLSGFEPALAGATSTLMAQNALEPYHIISGFAQIDGDIAVVASGRIQPDDIDELTAADMSTLVAGRWFDPSDLLHSAMLDDVSFVVAMTDVQIGQDMHTLTGTDGRPIGYLTWKTPRPGAILMKQATPAVVMLAILLMCGSWIVGRYSASQTEALLREQVSARTDPLTGLLNRVGIAEIVGRDDIRQQIEAGHVAVIYIDLNGLKQLNDTFGHAIGDAAIRVTADRLKAAVRAEDHVARIGGDEFVCLIADSDPHDVSQQIAMRLRQMMAVPVELRDTSFTVQAAMGLSVSANGVTWDVLLSQADAAMYHAKRGEMSGLVPYTETKMTAS